MPKFTPIAQRDKNKIESLNCYLEDLNDLEIDYYNIKDSYEGRSLKSKIKALEKQAARMRRQIMKIAIDLAKHMNTEILTKPAVAMPNLPIQHDLEALESRSNY